MSKGSAKKTSRCLKGNGKQSFGETGAQSEARQELKKEEE